LFKRKATRIKQITFFTIENHQTVTLLCIVFFVTVENKVKKKKKLFPWKLLSSRHPSMICAFSPLRKNGAFWNNCAERRHNTL